MSQVTHAKYLSKTMNDMGKNDIISEVKCSFAAAVK